MAERHRRNVDSRLDAACGERSPDSRGMECQKPEELEGMMFLRRLRADPHANGARTAALNGCPDIFELSKSGIGFSVGGSGFREGVSSRGRNDTSVGLPGIGLSCRASTVGKSPQSHYTRTSPLQSAGWPWPCRQRRECGGRGPRASRRDESARGSSRATPGNILSNLAKPPAILSANWVPALRRLFWRMCSESDWAALRIKGTSIPRNG